MRSFLWLTTLVIFTASCAHTPSFAPGDPGLRLEGEPRLGETRMLAREGESADARWSFDGTRLVFQRKGPMGEAAGPGCEQTYVARTDGSEPRGISTGKGRTASASFLPGDERAIFSSTHATDEACPARPDESQGYAWPLYPSYLVYSAKAEDGSDLTPFEPGQPRAYNAEAAVCRDGTVAFTSDRDGDPELYTGRIDKLGTLVDVRRITNAPGYDGGAAFSPDCKRIAWHASRQALKRHLVRPERLELWVGDADGSHARQVTALGAASFAPAFTPDGAALVFATTAADPEGRRPGLQLVRLDGTRLEPVTRAQGAEGGFDASPAFSPDGKHLSFTSRRTGRPQVLIADWLEVAPRAPTPQDPQPADRAAAIVERLEMADMEGRQPGRPGHAVAEDFVMARFEALGLLPYLRGEAGAEGFKQRVDFAAGAGKTPVSANNVIASFGKGCGRAAPVVLSARLEPSVPGERATGIAGLVEAARRIAADKAAARGCFVFAAFTGDASSGRAGSTAFVRELKDRRARPKAMIELDRIGALDDSKLELVGIGTAAEWKTLVDGVCAESSFSCADGTASAGDHLSFYPERVPVLSVSTGVRAELVNATGVGLVAGAAARLAIQASFPRQALRYRKGALAEPPPVQSRGKGAYLGTIPDYDAVVAARSPGVAGGGVRLAGVRSGSPAEKAGVRQGDVLTGIRMSGSDARPVASLEDYMNILVELKPGDEVTLELHRGEDDLKVPARVGKRQ